MADTKVSALDTLGSVDRAADYLYIVDATGPTSNKMTINGALGFTGGNPVSTSDTQTLTNKTLGITNTITLSDALFTLQDNSDNTKQAQFQLSGITTGTTRTYTLPNASSTLVDLSTAQTLTNKTLTSPTINTATIANPTLTVDTISEYTGAAGVTIDGLLIKDGLLPAGNVKPNQLQSGTGTSWAWQDWTPTLVNLSGGTQTFAKYVQIGKTVHFRFLYTLAGAGVSGAVTISLPVTSAISSGVLNASIGLLDSGTALFYGHATFNSATVIGIYAWNSASTYVTGNTSLSSTVPHTWAVNDSIFVSGTYEAA